MTKFIEVYTVKEINIIDNKQVGEFEFDSEEEALGYALQMNDLMKSTNLRYVANTNQEQLYN